MDATTFMPLAAACAPLVAPSTAQAIVQTESSFNPYAIGVVAGALQRQPRAIAEALSTATELRSHRYSFSVGLAQINVRNLDRFGFSVSEGFDPCVNLDLMQRLLLECFRRADSKGDVQHALRRALSCYYSGNFTTGFHHGYVKRVVSNVQKSARAPP